MAEGDLRTATASPESFRAVKLNLSPSAEQDKEIPQGGIMSKCPFPVSLDL